MNSKYTYFKYLIAFVVAQIVVEISGVLLSDAVNDWMLVIYGKNILLIAVLVVLMSKLLEVSSKINSIYIKNTKYFVSCYIAASIVLTALARGYLNTPITYLSKYMFERFQAGAHFSSCDAVCLELKLLFYKI